MAFKKLKLDRPGSNNNAHKRVAPLYSDATIVMGIWRSEQWQRLFIERKKAVSTVLLEILKFLREVSILPVRIWFRYSPGRKTTGWMVYLISLGVLIGYNSTYMLPPIAPLGLFFFGGVAGFGGSEAAYDFVFTNTRSEFLEIFTLAFAVRGLLQLVGMQWLGWRNDEDYTKRGHSLYRLITGSRFARHEPFVQRVIEPLICVGATYWMYLNSLPISVVVFFALASLAFIWQELMDYMHQKMHNYDAPY